MVLGLIFLSPVGTLFKLLNNLIVLIILKINIDVRVMFT